MRGIKRSSCRGAGSPWKSRKRSLMWTSSHCRGRWDGRMFVRETVEEGERRRRRWRRGSDSSSFQESVDTNKPGEGSYPKCLWVCEFVELVIMYCFSWNLPLQGCDISRKSCCAVSQLRVSVVSRCVTGTLHSDRWLTRTSIRCEGCTGPKSVLTHAARSATAGLGRGIAPENSSHRTGQWITIHWC